MEGKGVLQDGQRLKSYLLSGEIFDEALIRACEDRLYGLCRKLVRSRSDADDLYQQTWLKALQKADKFRTGSFYNWLCTICINLFRDQYRKTKRWEKITNDKLDAELKDYAISAASDGTSAESEALDNFTRDLLRREIERLPEKHRLPIVLYYYQGFGYEECAQTLKIPVGTVKSRLNAAKKKLQAEMEKSQGV